MNYSKMILNKSLASLSTLGIGGNANFYLEIKTIEEMQNAILFCKTEKIPFFILGKGSNCLFDDRGFKGIVLHNKIDFLIQDENLFHAGAGYSFSRLGTLSAKEGFGGLEFASGIPASVGGAVFMNAGANGAETKDTLESVDFIDENGMLYHYKKQELSFSYRKSSFQDKKGAIVSARFLLEKNSAARNLQLNIIQKRKETQPYSDKSAGCIFRNPENQKAGQLIDHCGLKGLSVGDASVSSLHANFLINRKTASSLEFKELIKKVQNKVFEKTGITLECEIRYIPYEL